MSVIHVKLWEISIKGRQNTILKQFCSHSLAERQERQGDMMWWLTSCRAVGDGKHLPSELLLLYFLDKLSGLRYEALDASVLPVRHTNFLSVGKEDEAVGDAERCAPSPVWRALSQNKNKMNMWGGDLFLLIVHQGLSCMYDPTIAGTATRLSRN